MATGPPSALNERPAVLHVTLSNVAGRLEGEAAIAIYGSMSSIIRQLPRPNRIIAGLGVTAWLCGCAASVPPAGPQFDGTYVGKTSLTRGFGFVCGVPDLPRELTVRDGRFLFPFQEQPPSLTTQVPVTIGENGTFSKLYNYVIPVPDQFRGQMPAMLLIDGRIQGNTLEATESDQRCARSLQLQRR